MKKLRRGTGSEQGIAMFMVISAVAVLAFLMAELTYSTQVNLRMAHNHMDHVKAYYLAKAAYKLSLVRLKAYFQVKDFVDNPANKQIKEALPKNLLDMLWRQPFMYPVPIPDDPTIIIRDQFKAFMDKSHLLGSFSAAITSESGKLNLNNLFIKKIQKPGAAASATSSTSATTPSTGTATQTPTPAAPTTTAETQDVDMRPAIELMISQALEQKKETDRDFSDTYRNLQGKDVMDAIMYYLFPNQPAANIPGFKDLKPKLAPLYSLSELHFIPGIEDPIYDILQNLFTVNTTAGINLNTLKKSTLRALIPELTDQDAEDVLRKRDDPDVGKPFAEEKEFWEAVQATSAAKQLDTIKKRFADANLKFVYSEQSFKIGIVAKVGQAEKRLEAYIIVDPTKKASKPATPATATDPNAAKTPAAASPTNAAAGQKPKEGASAKASSGIHLIYWRMI